MTEFYEFHDSHLMGLEYVGERLIVRLDAYRHLRPFGLDHPGTGWVQYIEITIDQPHVEFEFTSFPVQLYGGSLKAASLHADPVDMVGNEIPASLIDVIDVEIYLEGHEERTNEYKGMRINGKSAAITQKQEARFVENLK